MESVINVLVVTDEGKYSFIQQLLIEDMSIVLTMMNDFNEEEFIKDPFSIFFKSSPFDVIILSDSFQQFSILQFIRILKQKHVQIPIIVISERNETSLAVEVMKAGGENFLVEDHLTSISLIEVIYSALQSRDEQIQLENVRREIQKLSQVVEQSPVSIVITKAETNRIEYANPMFTMLTGYTFEEVKGECPSILKSGVKSKKEYEDLWDTILAGFTWKGEFINRKKSGELYCVSSIISPIKINNSDVTHFVGIQQDITKQKEAELKLQNYAKKLEKKSTELEQAYEAIDRNIKKARRLHRHFFPTSIPEVDNIQFEAFYEPAHKIGSDYYNYIKIKNQLIIYVVDVSGSGIDGAFINIFIRQKINRYLYVDRVDQLISPSELLNFLARHYVTENFPEEYFICMYVAVLNLNTNELSYSNAGIQVPPAVVHNGNLSKLSLGGLPISSAIDVSLLEYEEEKIFFGEGTTLLISTDGIVESVVNDSIYGIERLHQLVLNQYYLPAKEIRKVINSDINMLLEQSTNKDDITYVVVQNQLPIVAKKQFTIESDCVEVEAVVDFITTWLEQYTKDVNCILVGFNEMVYNAIEHGNKFDLTKKVIIDIKVNAATILISIEDEGNGFDWKKGMEKQLDIMNFEERGRGIIFTKASFDYITYNEKGNVVYLYKKIT